MFGVLYKYWYNVSDSPSNIFKINVWSYINIRFFKMKFSRNLVYFILSLKSFKINQIKVFYKDWIFEDFFYYLIKFISLLILFILFI
jgi:hypothetical protein